MTFLSNVRLRVPRPKTFLGLMSVRTGAEIAVTILIFVRALSVYAILLGLTVDHIPWLAFFYNLYNVVAFGILVYAVPHIRRQSPFKNLLLAWTYAIDTLVTVGFITAFAALWFSATLHPQQAKATAEAEAQAAAAAAAQATGQKDGRADKSPLESVVSLLIMVATLAVRVYFTLVVMAHASQVLQQLVESRANSADEPEGGKNYSDLEPFAMGTPEGEGIKGKIGRGMFRIGKSYWLAGRADGYVPTSRTADIEDGRGTTAGPATAGPSTA